MGVIKPHNKKASATGTVHGYTVSPFRTEGYAILSWVLFLHEYCIQNNIRAIAPIHPYTDNETATHYATTSPV